MSGKNNFSKMLKQKKTRKLFRGMLIPLLVLTVVACTFFYFVSNQILNAYMESQLKLSVEKLNSTVVESMQPIILNVDNFVTFAGDYDDYTVLELLLGAFGNKLDEYASMLYYAPFNTKGKDVKLLTNTDWVPPPDIDWTERVWFTEAVNNEGKTTYSSPYIDVNTGKLCVTISQAVYKSNGQLQGVIGCDILLDSLVNSIKEIKISKNAKLELITEDGFFLTNDDPSKVMTAN